MILRQISNGRQFNTDLSKQYQVVMQEIAPDEFQKIASDKFQGLPEMEQECYGFVCANHEAIPLYKKQQTYIMSESGKTFDNLNYR